MKYFYLLYDSAARFIESGAGYYAAAFSYYAPLALIPLLFLSVNIVGFFYGDAFTSQVLYSWGSVLGEDLVNIIKLAVNNLNSETETSNFAYIGAAFFLSFCIVALNTMSDGFQALWETESRGLKAWLVKSLRSIGFIFILQVYLISVVGLEFFVTPTLLGESELVATLILFLSTTAFFGVLYRLLPTRSPSWSGCFAGATVGAVLFVIAKNLVNIYISSTPVITLYGAAGLILILLIWIYILASLIYFGAAVAGLYDKIDLLNVRRK